MARIEANLKEAERRRQLDEEEVTDSEWERHTLRLAERRAVRRASALVGFQGQLVPIGEPDHAESLPREVIDHTDDSEDDILDLSSDTGDKGSYTQWVHGELILGSETICPPNIHWVQGEYL